MQIQKSFGEEPELSDRLFDLLETVFPGIGLQQLAAVGRNLGAPWEAASTPFMKFEDGKAIAHVGVLELPLCVMGNLLKVGGIHAVATHPNYRRQGHYRDCMEAALRYCESRYETLVLTTSQPELYQPFGFRVVSEFAFVVSGQELGQEETRKDCLRILNLDTEGDRALLHRLLNTRIPVSEVVGVDSEKPVFFVNEASRPLYYAEELDALVVMEREGDRLQIYDLVIDHSISLTDLLRCVSQPIYKITFYFSPDRLKIQAKPTPHVLDEACLMVRGPFAAEGQAFMLPRSARC